MTSDSCVISRIVFVIAPDPSVVARPATVGACQTRAQLSVLLLWNTVLTLPYGEGFGEGFAYAICYRVNGNEYWANNFGANYDASFSVRH